MKNLNKLEQIQSEENNINYIKSYPILNKLFKQSSQINIIQLILSYQTNNNKFYMSYSNIAEIFNIKTQTVRNTINALHKEGYLICENISNYNKTTNKGGSKTYIQVDLDKIVNDIQNKNTSTKEVKTKEIKEDTIPTSNNIPKETKEVLKPTQNKSKDNKEDMKRILTHDKLVKEIMIAYNLGIQPTTVTVSGKLVGYIINKKQDEYINVNKDNLNKLIGVEVSINDLLDKITNDTKLEDINDDVVTTNNNIPKLTEEVLKPIKTESDSIYDYLDEYGNPIGENKTKQITKWEI